MELRHLRYFVAVAEEGHITRAAYRLGMAQPPLSQQLRRLERDLGVTLFKRLPRGVALTAAGTAFLREARLVLDAAVNAAAKAGEAARGEAGQMAIGVTTSAVLHPMIGGVIADVVRSYPGISIQVREGNAAEMTEAVANRALDAAFLRSPVSWPAGVRFRPLLTEPMLAVLPSDHRLLGDHPTCLALGALADERFVLTRRPSMPGMYDDLLYACRAAGFEPRVAAEVGRMLTNITLVAAGVGVSVVPASMRAIRLRGVNYVRLSGAGALTAPITLATREVDENPVLANFIGIVGNHCSKGR